MKKSSISRSSVSIGQIDSADSGAEEWPESAARACAACVGDAGEEVPDMPAGEAAALCCSSSRLRLMASACRFGGPRLLLGRSKVHGISSAAHARHGGPVSSHFTFLILHESHALRRRFVFCGCSGVEVCVGGFESPPALVGWLVTGVGCWIWWVTWCMW